MHRSLRLLSIALMACLTIPAILLAQDQPPWELEASIIYNNQSYDFSSVDHSIDSRIKHERESLPNRTIEDPKRIKSTWEPDLKFGFRYRDIHFGFIYTGLREQTVGYTSYIPGPNGAQFNTWKYEITSSTREYLISLGYSLQLMQRLSFGLYGAAGWGVARGTVVDHYGVPGTSDVTADLRGKYNPWHVEARMRVALTRYLDFDFGGGYRHSKLDKMTANYGLEIGDLPISDYEATEFVTFDWSGTFFGAGITLRNPYGGK